MSSTGAFQLGAFSKLSFYVKEWYDVVENQTPAWNGIPTTQTPNWVAVVDNQTTNWTPVT